MKTPHGGRPFSVMPVIGLLALVWTTVADGGTFMLRLGPPALGNGGPNPLSIPPTSPAEYEFSYLTDKKNEWIFSMSPGLFYGWRNQLNNGLYVSLGPGIAIDANGAALGAYSAFGYDFSCGSAGFCFNMEYKQAVGIAGGGLLCPYALRMGFGYKF